MFPRLAIYAQSPDDALGAVGCRYGLAPLLVSALPVVFWPSVAIALTAPGGGSESYGGLFVLVFVLVC